MNKYQVTVPEGKSGIWEVKKFTVTGKEFQPGIFKRGGRYVPPGNYTKLTHKGHTIMSDTPDEINDHLSVIHKAKGNILIAGLGLGVVLQACAEKEEVIHITVIEKSEDVIKLVSNHYLEMFPNKITIIQAAIFEWKPLVNAYYDIAWYDIWDNICADNLEEMKKLHRKFGRKTGWQGSWSRWWCEYYRGLKKER